jgi:hypothetical protein
VPKKLKEKQKFVIFKNVFTSLTIIKITINKQNVTYLPTHSFEGVQSLNKFSCIGKPPKRNHFLKSIFTLV